MKEKIQMAIVMKTVKVRTPLTIIVMKIKMLSGRKDSKKGKNIASYEVRLGRLRIDICNKCYLNSYTGCLRMNATKVFSSNFS